MSEGSRSSFNSTDGEGFNDSEYVGFSETCPSPPQTYSPSSCTGTFISNLLPPKQVLKALERLGEAGRLIADVRLGADWLLDTRFFVASDPHNQQSSRCLNLIVKEESLMHQYLQNLRSIGIVKLLTR